MRPPLGVQVEPKVKSGRARYVELVLKPDTRLVRALVDTHQYVWKLIRAAKAKAVPDSKLVEVRYDDLKFRTDGI